MLLAGREERSALFAAAELAALAGVNQTDDAFIVIGALRLAERFPLFDAGASCLFVFLILRRVAHRIVQVGRRAHAAIELAVGAAFNGLPSLRRCRQQG